MLSFTTRTNACNYRSPVLYSLHNRKALLGASGHRSLAKYTPHAEKGPIKMQDHGDPVRYRNIWLRALKDYDQP